MRIVIRNLCLVLASLTVTVSVVAESTSVDEKPNIARYDDIIIDVPVEDIWPEVINFVYWFSTEFEGNSVVQIKGEPGQVGYTLEVNSNRRHEIISVRPMKSIVWKTCLIASCEDDYVFSDHSLEANDGKTKFSRNSYSQGFWTAEYIEEVRQKQLQGKTFDSLNNKVSLAFKEYVENR